MKQETINQIKNYIEENKDSIKSDKNLKNLYLETFVEFGLKDEEVQKIIIPELVDIKPIPNKIGVK